MNFAEVKSLTIPEGVVVRILSGDTVLWTKATGGLPSEYQQVSYIETDGNQYIDTGVMASDYSGGISYVWHGKATATLSSSSNNRYFGAMENGKRSGNLTYHSGQYRFLIGSSRTTFLISEVLPATGFDRKFVANYVTSENAAAATATIDGVSLTPSGTMPNSTMPEANIYLFSCNGASTGSWYCGRLYFFTMDTADGTPIRNFVPCYRKADSVIGLYDTVGGAFYTNAGTGSFAKGADV